MCPGSQKAAVPGTEGLRKFRTLPVLNQREPVFLLPLTNSVWHRQAREPCTSPGNYRTEGTHHSGPFPIVVYPSFLLQSHYLLQFPPPLFSLLSCSHTLHLLCLSTTGSGQSFGHNPELGALWSCLLSDRWAGPPQAHSSPSFKERTSSWHLYLNTHLLCEACGGPVLTLSGLLLAAAI